MGVAAVGVGVVVVGVVVVGVGVAAVEVVVHEAGTERSPPSGTSIGGWASPAGCNRQWSAYRIRLKLNSGVLHCQ